MKKCPFCAEDIQDAARVCKHCGRELVSGASQIQLTAPQKKTSFGTWLVLGLLVIPGIVFLDSLISTPTYPAATVPPAPTTPARPATPPKPTYELALLSVTGEGSEGHGYYIVEGQVRNISNQPLKNVMAVTTWFDKDGGFIKSDDAMVDYNPILPGQISPFKTMTTGNPLMSKYTIEFKTLFGGTLAVDNQQKNKGANKGS